MVSPSERSSARFRGSAELCPRYRPRLAHPHGDASRPPAYSRAHQIYF